MSSATTPRFVTVAELADLLRVSRDVIYSDADRLGAIRVGNTIRFDVDDAIRRARTTPTPTVSTPAPTIATRQARTTTTTTPLLPIKGQP
jgi:excisionase family DNA binding protein